MHGGVVELHALTDPDRSGAEHHDFFLIRKSAVVFAGVTGVKIGDVLSGMQCINHPEYRADTVLQPLCPDKGLRCAPLSSNLPVAEAHLLGFCKYGSIPKMDVQFFLHFDDL